MAVSPELVAARITAIQKTIPESVTLVAVTKQVPPHLMAIAYEMGIRNFGESKVQEAAEKQAQLSSLTEITWHLIGHLQRNKANKALDQFQWIHSVDSIRLAQRIDHLAAMSDSKPKVCLQVKLRSDPNKYGWSIEALLQDMPQLDQLENLRIQGLMTIPPYGLSAAENRAIFDDARQLAEKLQQYSPSHITMDHLSMGMSDDYLVAIEAGATMVRLGRAIFGER
ncbi:MAG: YggS family pyridoxal phosphate-dependent enzyme [Elainellaceae cyanobacterium]